MKLLKESSLPSLAPVSVQLFGKIGGHHFVQGQTPECCALPGLSIFRITTPMLSFVQAVTSPANGSLPNAFNKKVGRSVASSPLSSWLPGRSFFRQNLCVCFFQSPAVEWHVAHIYKRMMFLFLKLAVNFLLLWNKPTLSQEEVFMPESQNTTVLPY